MKIIKNIEGIRNVEIPESQLEKTSVRVSETVDLKEHGPDIFDDCALTEKERLEKLKEEILNFDDCVKTESGIFIEDNFDDCKKR